MREELLPCPFCGRRPLGLSKGGPNWNNNDLWGVVCHCPAQIGFDYATPEQATMVWNRRTPPAPSMTVEGVNPEGCAVVPRTEEVVVLPAPAPEGE